MPGRPASESPVNPTFELARKVADAVLYEGYLFKEAGEAGQ